jgi:hypothetical protein
MKFTADQVIHQIKKTKKKLASDALIYEAFIEMTQLIRVFFHYIEESMDKKMHKVTKKIEVAEKDIKKGKPSEAIKVLKTAAKKNEKLVKIDRDVRDPMIKKCKKEMKQEKKKK